MVVVRGVDPHRAAGVARVGERDPRGRPLLGERPILVVAEQVVGLGVIGDGQVDPAIPVVVAEGDAERLPLQHPPLGIPGQPRLRRHVRERAVAVVVEQLTAFPRKRLRPAVGFVLAVQRAADVGLGGPFHVMADKQIQLAIPVIVDKSRARAPAARGHARFRGHVGERAISVVVVQHVVRKTRDVNVRIAVVVVIADGNPHAINAAVRYAGGLRHIRKRSVGILAVERIPARLAIHRELVASALHQKNIQPPVLVVIEKRAPAAHRLDQILVRRCAVDVLPVDSEAFRHVREDDSGQCGRLFAALRKRRTQHTERENCSHRRIPAEFHFTV